MRVRTVAVMFFVLLGAGLLTRITDHAGMPPKKTDHAPVEIRAEEELSGTETVDLQNGNLHLHIPLPATHQKTTALRSDH